MLTRLLAYTNSLHPNVPPGAMIVKRNMKIGDLTAKWDKDGDGSVSKAEFRKNVGDLGVVGVTDFRSEVDALFDSYDDDGGGDLSLEELKPTLKRLIDAAQNAVLMIKQLEKEATSLRKAAAKQQRQLLKAKAEQEEAVRVKAEADAKAAEEEAAAKTEAKRLAKEAKAAQAAAKAAEQAEYDAKIAARRKAS